MTDLPGWLQEIRDRADKATPGPWEALDYSGVVTGTTCDVRYVPENPDAQFIAHARTDVPRLIALVGEMAETLDEMAPSYALEKGCFFPEDCTTCAELNRHNCPGYMAERVRRKYRGEVDEP